MPGLRGCLVVTFALLAPLVHAADQPLPGSQLSIQAPSADPARRKIAVTAKLRPGSAVTVNGDPVVAGATLEIATQGGTSVDQTFALPAAGWRAIGSSGFKYANTRTGGAVKSALLRRSASGVVQLKVSVRGTDGAVDVVPPNPGDEAAVVLAFGDGNRYCLAFGGTAGGIERRDDARSWVVRDTAAVPCPSPSTTTTSTETTTSSSTTTSTTSSTSTTIPTTTTSTTTTTSSSTTTSSTSTSSTSTSTSSSSTTTSSSTTS